MMRPMRRNAGCRDRSAPSFCTCRAPLGGLFRHVTDLVRGQAARGHHVGLIVDSATGGPRAETVLRELSPCLALGYQRLAYRANSARAISLRCVIS